MAALLICCSSLLQDGESETLPKQPQIFHAAALAHTTFPVTLQHGLGFHVLHLVAVRIGAAHSPPAGAGACPMPGIPTPLPCSTPYLPQAARHTISNITTIATAATTPNAQRSTVAAATARKALLLLPLKPSSYCPYSPPATALKALLLLPSNPSCYCPSKPCCYCPAATVPVVAQLAGYKPEGPTLSMHYCVPCSS